MTSLLRFTLDLFSPEPAPVPEKTKKFKHNPPEDQQARAQAAPESIATGAAPASPKPAATPALLLADVGEPLSAAHPRANREALLGTLRVGFELKRGKRRTIGFSISADGLTVSAPKWVKLGDIDAALLEKSAWIVRKLHEVRARHERLTATRVVWCNGAELPFLGQPVRIVLDPRQGMAGVGAELQALAADGLTSPAAPRVLLVGLPLASSPEQIQGVVQTWLRRQATRVFTERLQHFAPQLGVSWRQLKLSNAGTRWGSASADGSIRLHWRLIHFRQPVLDYVVVHELSHLRFMDHSPRFWDTVRAVMPDYAGLRRELKDESIARW
jgi:predicted metal-dependent hydrolase